MHTFNILYYVMANTIGLDWLTDNTYIIPIDCLFEDETAFRVIPICDL